MVPNKTWWKYGLHKSATYNLLHLLDGETEKASGTWGYCGKYCPLGYGDKCKNRKRIPRFLEEWKVDPVLKVWDWPWNIELEYFFHILVLRKSLLKSKAPCWVTSSPSIVQQPTQQLRLGSRQKEDGGTLTSITLHLVDFLSIIKVGTPEIQAYILKFS